MFKNQTETAFYAFQSFYAFKMVILLSIRFNSCIKPMLAVKAEPFSNDDYIFEIKWDGTRCISFINNRGVRLQNRRLKDITYRYPELHSMNKILNGSAILDGEIVVLREAKPNFNLLQLREQVDNPNVISLRSRLYPAVYIIFDMLYFKGKDITKKPLMERKKYLKRLKKKDHPNIIILDYIEGAGKEYFKLVKKEGFEGLMAKHKRSIYEPGKRSIFWKKIKAVNTVDAVICGYRVNRRPIASFLIGLYEKGQKRGIHKRLRYIGSVGTGFDEDTMMFIHNLIKRHITTKPPEGFKDEKHVVWVKPIIVCEVEYQKLTCDGMLRAPAFKRLRYDKRPEECTTDQLK